MKEQFYSAARNKTGAFRNLCLSSASTPCMSKMAWKFG